MLPGMNVLDMCLTIISKQGVVYYKSLGRVANAVGQDITLYEHGQTVLGSWQPVPRELYSIYGLDLTRDYFTFYASKDVIDVGRDVSGDQIAFNGQRYQCESDNDWYDLDGWVGVLCVHIGKDNADKYVWGFGTIPASTTYRNFCHGNFMSDPT